MRGRMLFALRVGLAAAGPLLLAGCLDGETGSGSGAERLAGALLGPAAPDATQRIGAPGQEGRRLRGGRADRTIDGMVEVPEIFADTAEIEWDGSDTLGGLWIAHSGIDRAQRVRLTNSRTRVTVDAALLPRHGPSAGRSVLVSSDTADALGIVPGIADTIDMVAIEPVDVQLASTYEDPVATAAADEQVASAEDGAIGAAPAETAEQWSVAEPEPPVAAKPAEPPAEARTAEARNDPAPADARSVEAKPEPARLRRTEPLAATTTLAAARATDPVPGVERQARPPRSEPVAAAPAAQTRQTPAPSAPATEPATPVAPAAQPAKPRAERVAAVKPRAPAPEPTGPIQDGRPFVQSGILKSPELAADLVRTLAAYGVVARNAPETVNGETRNRVVAGPFDTHESRTRTLDLFRAIGVYGARPSAG